MTVSVSPSPFLLLYIIVKILIISPHFKYFYRSYYLVCVYLVFVVSMFHLRILFVANKSYPYSLPLLNGRGTKV